MRLFLGAFALAMTSLLAVEALEAAAPLELPAAYAPPYAVIDDTDDVKFMDDPEARRYLKEARHTRCYARVSR